MDELKFRCPAYLAQRFWLLCAERNQTPGAVLRNYMVEEIGKADAGFSFDLQAATGQDVWAVCEGKPIPHDPPEV